MDERKEGLATYSAKVDPDIKTLLQSKIEESGKTAGEFISALLATYETAQNRESVYDIRELNQLKNHLARIEEIYVSMAKSRKDLEETANANVTFLQDGLKALKTELHDLKKSSADEVAEAKKQAEIALSEFDKLREAKERSEKLAETMSSTLEQQKNLIAELRDTAVKAKDDVLLANSNAEMWKRSFEEHRASSDALLTQAKIDAADTMKDAWKEANKDMTALHERIEALQEDKLKLTEALSTEREKVARLEPKQEEKEPIKMDRTEPRDPGGKEKFPRTEPRE